MNIIDRAKELIELIKKYNDRELYQRIVDLRDEIIKAPLNFKWVSNGY